MTSVVCVSFCVAEEPTTAQQFCRRGDERNGQKRFDEALSDYAKAIELDANIAKKDDKNAVSDYTEALRLDPAIEMIHYRRGQAYHNLKMYAEAHADFKEALQQNPNYGNLLISWAWQLATCPDEKYRDGPLALHLATKARHFDTMAAAYAEVGQFDEAFKCQRRAIVRLKKGEEEERKAMELRSTLYESHQAFREE